MAATGGAGGTRVRGAGRDDLDLLRVYLNGLDHYPLLNREDEVRLARLIESGREAADRLAAGGVRPAQRSALQRAVHAGVQARQEFASANLRLVVSIAKRFQRRGVAISDLIQEGNLGLLRAVDRFDWRQGHKFSTYATWWITNGVVQALGEQVDVVHLPRQRRRQARVLAEASDRLEHETGHRPGASELSVATGIALDDVAVVRRAAVGVASLQSPIDEDGSELGDVVADPAADVGEAVSLRLLPAEVDQLLDGLPPSSVRVLRLRFGLGGEEARTAAQVAAMLSVSPERVCQIERRALARLRNRLRTLQPAS